MNDLFVSVIIPVRNEARFITRCLAAVLAQDYPAQQMEILVADGQSDDNTVAIIRAMPGAERIRIIPNPRRLQAAGLNAMIRIAQGDFIVRVDGHTVLAPDYVRQCVAAYQETNAQNVGGAMDPAGETAMGRAIAAATKSRFAVPSAFHVSAKGQYTDTVYLGAWPRTILEQIGGFDEKMRANQDYEMNVRIRQAGGTIYLSPAIRSTYYCRQTLADLWRQYYQYGQWKVMTLRKHPTSVRPRQLVAPAFVAALCIGGGLAVVSPPVRLFWLTMLALYGAVNGVFSFQVAKRVDLALLWRIPLVFTTIHIAWGIGFWAGCLMPTKKLLAPYSQPARV